MRHASPESRSMGSVGIGRSSLRRARSSPGVRMDQAPTLPASAMKSRRLSATRTPLRATTIYSGARMVALMNRPKIVPVDVRVELRCGKVGVAQHLLYGAKICPALEQVRRKRVPQGVRRHALD